MTKLVIIIAAIMAIPLNMQTFIPIAIAFFLGFLVGALYPFPEKR